MNSRKRNDCEFETERELINGVHFIISVRSFLATRDHPPNTMAAKAAGGESANTTNTVEDIGKQIYLQSEEK